MQKVIDIEDALDRVQDDKELLFELFDIFEADFVVKRKELEQCLKNNNAEMVRNIAHSVKGASGNISAKCIHEICLFIEQQASEGNLTGLLEKLQRLDEEFIRYQKEAKKLREEDQLI